ncbi:hypothetical protein CYY_002421 [Polysphondylium violaceum]|uniref:Reticulon-like protein n=1 Tax=Polysphondylium violaceum TaxID=133409 RepID=A0A8J4UV72_9MYCE|nr:hypothetical protein CYY_002421 [Polysphondylium violaceum]
MEDNKVEVDEIISEVEEGFVETEKEVAEVVSNIKEDVQKIKEDIKEIPEAVSSTVSNAASTIKSKVNEIKEDIKSATSTSSSGCPYALNGEYSLCTQVKKVISVLEKNPCFGCTKDIVLWTDLIQSAILFVIVNLVFLLVCCFKYSVVSLFGYTAFAITASSILFHVISLILTKYAQGITLDNAVTEQLKTLSFHVHESVVEKQVSNLYELVNVIGGIAKDVFGCKSVYLSAQFAIVFYGIACFGKCLSLATIFYSGFLIAFIVPRLYLEKKEFFDQQCAKISAIGKEALNKLHSFIPMPSSKKTN